MELLSFLYYILTFIFAVFSAYFLQRERLIKSELKIKEIEKEIAGIKTANDHDIEGLKNTIEKLTTVINKLEKAIVKLETQLEERKN